MSNNFGENTLSFYPANAHKSAERKVLCNWKQQLFDCTENRNNGVGMGYLASSHPIENPVSLKDVLLTHI